MENVLRYIRDQRLFQPGERVAVAVSGGADSVALFRILLDLRHQWFAELVGQGHADTVATAHTLDDQAETVLMRVLRGTGVRGLAGIAPKQREKHLVRPLLRISRREIETYLGVIHQSWRTDSSNLDLSHTR